MGRDADAYYPTRIEPDGEVMLVPPPPNRQGWRARLANVERLLVEMADNIVPVDGLRHRDALAEVRAMLDGE